MGSLLRNIFIGSVVGATIYSIASDERARQKAKNEYHRPDSGSPVSLPLSSWKRALKETVSALQNKSLTVWSAALAYYGTFAFFPSLVAFIAIYSLVISQQQLEATILAAEVYLPKDIAGLVTSQLNTLSENPTANIVAATLSIALALFGASAATQNLIKATNLAYDVRDGRNFIKQRLLGIAMVLAGILLALPLLGLLILQSDFLSAWGAPQWVVAAFPFVRWVLLALIVTVVLAAIYRYIPNRANPRWQWVSWGATAATIIWLAGSAAFFYYLQSIANFQESYGIFAGIIALMLWLNLSAFIILLGAQVNHRLESQTSAVTTSR